MPWFIRKEDERFCVVRGTEEEPLETEACHETEDAAIAQMRTLYASETKNALKAISETEDEMRVANYIVLFGGRDLEGVASTRKNEDGTVGEFFTPRTELESSYTKTGVLYVDWEHGQGKRLDGKDAPGGDDVLGVVDWKTARIDDRGVWVERVLDRRNRYVQMLETLIREGAVGSSSEAIYADTQKGANGEIIRWPLKRDTLTVQPMEPRMMSENAISALKALGYLPEPQQPEAEPEAQAGGDAAEKATVDDIKPVEKTMEAKMPEETFDIAAIAKAAAEQAVKAYQEKLEAEKPAAPLQVVKDEADKAIEAKPFKSMGEFLTAIVGGKDARLGPVQSTDPLDERGYSVGKAIGMGQVGTLHEARQKAISGMSELVPADGGLLVQTDVRMNIMSRMYQVGELLRRVSMIPISANANGLTLYGENESSRATGSRRGGVRGYWAAEGDEKTSSHPTFREINFKLNKLVGLVYATDELLADASALGAYVMQVLPEELRFLAENAIIRGVGAGQPLGVLNAGCLVTQAAEAGQAANTVISENVINMWSRRWGGSNDYIWLVNQDVTPQLHQMNLGVGTGGQLTYMPAGGLSQSPYASLMGRPVVELEYCSTLGDVGDIILFSPSQYQMIEKGGIQSAMSIHVRFIYDEQVFRFVYRLDGQPMWHLPLTPFQGTATQSPFVALAAR